MGHCHRYQLLSLVRKSAICKHGLAERLKSSFGLWRQLAPLLGELKRGLDTFHCSSFDIFGREDPCPL
jgi:hypothetical protein